MLSLGSVALGACMAAVPEIFGSAEARPDASVTEMEPAKEVGPGRHLMAHVKAAGLLGERSGSGPGVERDQDGRGSPWKSNITASSCNSIR